MSSALEAESQKLLVAMRKLKEHCIKSPILVCTILLLCRFICYAPCGMLQCKSLSLDLQGSLELDIMYLGTHILIGPYQNDLSFFFLLPSVIQTRADSHSYVGIIDTGLCKYARGSIRRLSRISVPRF